MGNNNLANRIAQQLINDLGIKPEDALFTPPNCEPYVSAQQIYEKFRKAIWQRVRRMSSARLGQIAACGKGERSSGEGRTREYPYKGTPLYSVHCAMWLSKYEDGISLLREIARTAIIAEMKDILTVEHKANAA